MKSNSKVFSWKQIIAERACIEKFQEYSLLIPTHLSVSLDMVVRVEPTGISTAKNWRRLRIGGAILTYY